MGLNGLGFYILCTKLLQIFRKIKKIGKKILVVLADWAWALGLGGDESGGGFRVAAAGGMKKSPLQLDCGIAAEGELFYRFIELILKTDVVL